MWSFFKTPRELNIQPGRALANQITGEKRIFVNRRPKKNQRGEAIVLEYTPFLKVQSYTFDADF